MIGRRSVTTAIATVLLSASGSLSQQNHIGADNNSQSLYDPTKIGAYDNSRSLYDPQEPRALDPEFALRLAAALSYAKNRSLLEGDEGSRITDMFRTRDQLARTLVNYYRNPGRYAHKPGAETSHAASFASDLGDNSFEQDKLFSTTGAMSALVIALAKQGLYYPLLSDPVHVEVHPESNLKLSADIAYASRFGKASPVRLNYSQQLEALRLSSSSMHGYLTEAKRAGLTNWGSVRFVKKFNDDLDRLDSKGSLSEDAAMVTMAPLIADMHTLFRAGKVANKGDAALFRRLYSDLSITIDLQKRQMIAVQAARLWQGAMLSQRPSGVNGSVRVSSSVMKMSNDYWSSHTPLQGLISDVANDSKTAIQIAIEVEKSALHAGEDKSATSRDRHSPEAARQNLWTPDRVLQYQIQSTTTKVDVQLNSDRSDEKPTKESGVPKKSDSQ